MYYTFKFKLNVHPRKMLKPQCGMWRVSFENKLLLVKFRRWYKENVFAIRIHFIPMYELPARKRERQSICRGKPYKNWAFAEKKEILQAKTKKLNWKKYNREWRAFSWNPAAFLSHSYIITYEARRIHTRLWRGGGQGVGGWTVSTIWKYESGYTIPTPQMKIRLQAAEAFSKENILLHTYNTYIHTLSTYAMYKFQLVFPLPSILNLNRESQYTRNNLRGFMERRDN